MVGEKYKKICDDIKLSMKTIEDFYKGLIDNSEACAIRELRETLRDMFKQHSSSEYTRIACDNERMFKKHEN